jgi:D-tagatose-1,6-bisphosphate aldolase subunit GatZ/KbaZ
MNGVEELKEIVRDQHRGKMRGVYSICSSHPYVIQAALRRAKGDGSMVLIESTSNQVNQFGGYTGMKPEDFRDFVYSHAREMEFPIHRLILGGDHLGPVPFKGESVNSAMGKASVMVQRFVEAGFVKIHLDTSVPLGAEGPINPAEIATRCSRLCRMCEDTYMRMGISGRPAPVYVIGTEVPAPGGSDEVEEGVRVTSEEDLGETISLTRDAFRREGLSDAWERVIAVVVQPGVEFGDHRIIEYNRANARELSSKIKEFPNIVFEAHSTDYQQLEKLRELIQDGFAILKVGPALTFAFREGVYLLSRIEDELCAVSGGIVPSQILETVDASMRRNPVYWEHYYEGDEQQKMFKRRYSLFDRIRYYWSDDEVNASFLRLLGNLEKTGIPLTLLSQYFPVQYERIRKGVLKNVPGELLRDKIMGVISDYSCAAGMCKETG